MSKKIIGFRVSEEERELLERLAAAENKELSEYIRERVFADIINYELKCSCEKEKEELKQAISSETKQVKELLTEQLKEQLNDVKSEIETLKKSINIVNSTLHKKCNVDMLTLAFFLFVQAAAIIFILKSV